MSDANSVKKDTESNENILELNKKDRHKSSSKKKEYFYRVENHSELFKIGSSYLQDFNNGLKSFAIGSTGYQNSQQKTILGIASFFDHYSDYKTAIISDNLFESTFKDLIMESDEGTISFGEDLKDIRVFNFHDHFDFIDLNILLEVGSASGDKHNEDRLQELIDYYDILFWDLPDLSLIKEHPETYYLLIRSFDSLSIVVSSTDCSEKTLDNIKTFFQSYNINIKGLLFDPSQKPEKKSWWRSFFK